MASERLSPPTPVLDLCSFQLIRDGRPVKLEKTPLEILTLLVQRRGTLVSREEIVRKIWGNAVHVDVDAGINTAIRKIRQALDDNPAQPHFLETVVGKGYRFTGPITVIEAYSDMAPPASAPDPSRRRAFRTRIMLSAAGLAGMVLLVFLFSHRNKVVASVGHQDRVVIGITPLRNLSRDAAEDYFVDGLTDEIVTQLGQLNPERLGVVRCGLPRTTPGRGAADACLGINPQLQYLLEGSVRRDHGQVRITVRLVRSADQTSLLTDSFDRKVGDVLALQSEIAQRVGQKFQIQILSRGRMRPASTEMVEAYLRGRFEMNRIDSIPDAARAYFERAVALDPFYAPAYAGLADFYRARAVRDDEGAEDQWRLANQYAAQALSLDSDSAEAHAALAQIKLMHDWNWQSARQHALRALELNPSSPEAHSTYARYLRTAGKVAEAVRQREEALALDPFRVDLKQQLDLEHFFARDYQEIQASARQTLAREPNDLGAHGDLCMSLGRLRRFEESVAECSKELALEGHVDWAAPYLREYHARGYEAANQLLAKKALAEVLRRNQPDLWDLANAYVAAGMRKEAMQTLLRGLAVHEPGLLQVRVDPDFDSLRSDPQYAELVSRIAFPTE